MVCSSCGNNEAMYCAKCFHSASGRTAGNTVGTQPTDVQQLKAEIRAMCIELECTSHDKFDSGMYHALRGRLRELSAV